MKTPLLVVLVRLGNAAESEPYSAVLRETFAGMAATTAGVPPRELLQPGEFREFVLETAASLPEAFNWLVASADRILVLVLDARASEAPTAGTLIDVETTLTSLLRRHDGPHAILTVSLKVPDSLFDGAPNDPHVVRLGLTDLDERDLQLPFLSLYSLHNALGLFSGPVDKATNPTGASAKAVHLFFSHAKRDGVPLTTALWSWMKRLKGFEAFYDAVNLDLEGDVDEQLQRAVKAAIVIVFRTDVFDQRYWCQREVLWAEQHGRPVVTVDARWHIEHLPSVISFDSTPVVRIPDGSVVRILAGALGEALRIELFRSRAVMHGAALADTAVVTVPRYPSLVSLQEACLHLVHQTSTYRLVVYPNPSMPDTLLRAAEGLAESMVEGCRVLSLDEFRLRI